MKLNLNYMLKNFLKQLLIPGVVIITLDKTTLGTANFAAY